MFPYRKAAAVTARRLVRHVAWVLLAVAATASLMVFVLTLGHSFGPAERITQGAVTAALAWSALRMRRRARLPT